MRFNSMTKPTHKSYELTTIQDIMDKVPTDRILDCMVELGKLMQSTKATCELVLAISQENAKLAGKEIQIPAGEKLFAFDYPLTWEDDGQEELTTHFNVGKGDEARELMTMKITKNEHD
jgi:hypothetical protein